MIKHNMTSAELSKKYEEFHSVFLSRFILAGYEKKTDLETIKEYIKYEYDTVELAKSEGREIDYDTIPQCIKEGREVLKLKPFPWEWIRSSANGIGYYTPEEANIYSKEELAKRWLTSIIDALEKEAIKAGKLQAQKKIG